MQITHLPFCLLRSTIFPLWILTFYRLRRTIISRRRTIMWPLSIFLFVATAAPQQPQLNVAQDFRTLQLPVMQHRQFQFNDSLGSKLLEQSRRNTCYTMRSYFFRRQDGQAPVPAGMTTCTPASVSQQRQVSPRPGVLFVPLVTKPSDQ